jgi:hypothetical protein
MSDSQFGGRISIRAAGFNLSPTEADIRIKTSPVSKEAKANQDGSACYMLKAILRSAEFNFRRGRGPLRGPQHGDGAGRRQDAAGRGRVGDQA